MSKTEDLASTTSLSALLEGGNDRSFRTAVEDIWRCAQRISAINNLSAAQVGLSPPHYSIIMTLAYEPDGISISALTERLAVSQPFVTREIGQLVQAGLAVKRANPGDGRSILVSLTKKGELASAKLMLLLQETNDILFKNITRDDFKFLKQLASGIANQSEVALQYAEGRFKQSVRQQRSANPIVPSRRKRKAIR
jgi:DNA-binding MarR family transcriptional regulator